jgi:homoserine kinase
MLRGSGWNPILSIEKGLPLSGGMGGSAASSVAGACAAALASGRAIDHHEILTAALEGERTVSGLHLDNLAPSTLGGLTLSLGIDPSDVVPLNVDAAWWIALVTPDVRIETKSARAILPASSERKLWIQQMANAAGVVHAFATGDGELLRRALRDLYAEPHRAPMIPRFAEARYAALDSGALTCAISGSGPTLFSITPDQQTAESVARAVSAAFTSGGIAATSHAGPIDLEGVRAV